MSRDLRITRTERNVLFDTFTGNGLNLNDFHLAKETPDFQIKANSDFFSFTIEKHGEDKYFLRYTNVDGPRTKEFWKTWTETVRVFSTWCEEVHKEISIPSKWDEIQPKDFFKTESRHLDETFEEEHKKVIREGLIYIGGELQDIKDEDLAIIKEKLDNLSKQVDNLSKFNWWSLFRGIVENLASQAIISPDSVSKFYEAIKMAFNSNQLH